MANEQYAISCDVTAVKGVDTCGPGAHAAPGAHAVPDAQLYITQSTSNEHDRMSISNDTADGVAVFLHFVHAANVHQSAAQRAKSTRPITKRTRGLECVPLTIVELRNKIVGRTYNGLSVDVTEEMVNAAVRACGGMRHFTTSHRYYRTASNRIGTREDPHLPVPPGVRLHSINKDERNFVRSWQRWAQIVYAWSKTN